MECPEHTERAWFEYWREQQGWPMIPKEILDACAELIREAEADGGEFLFHDVPIQHLNLQEARAALAMMYHHRFRLGGDITGMEA
jgi:hypothetical protein